VSPRRQSECFPERDVSEAGLIDGQVGAHGPGILLGEDRDDDLRILVVGILFDLDGDRTMLVSVSSKGFGGLDSSLLEPQPGLEPRSGQFDDRDRAQQRGLARVVTQKGLPHSSEDFGISKVGPAQ
jgi:hypothetical protein